MQYRLAVPGEYPEILALQKLAYITEAEIYGDYTIPPLTQTLEEMKTECAVKTVLIAAENGVIVGSVRAHIDQNNVCQIVRLMTHPDYRGKGIASELMLRIEREFPGAERFVLFTGEMSRYNIRLYERLGYRIYTTKPLNDKISLVFMEKTPNRPA
jgi:ribosomal protein S18 acetylase RimI-like enzyme